MLRDGPYATRGVGTVSGQDGARGTAYGHYNLILGDEMNQHAFGLQLSAEARKMENGRPDVPHVPYRPRVLQFANPRSCP
jgi:hypothetical protein